MWMGVGYLYDNSCTFYVYITLNNDSHRKNVDSLNNESVDKRWKK